MATLISAIETQVRLRLEEPTAKFWTSAELVAIIISGIKDLWREVVNIKQEHFLTYDVTNVSLAADTSTLTGVPTDTYRVYLIEPRDTSANGTNRDLVFLPAEISSPEFRGARGRDDIDPRNDYIYYAIINQGAPTGAPVIRVAPQVTSAVDLLFVYVPVVSSALVAGSDVPIPGECDNALVAWTVAYARAKEREDRAPDPGWLALYAAERARLMASLGVRQQQEPEMVRGVFQDLW